MIHRKYSKSFKNIANVHPTNVFVPTRRTYPQMLFAFLLVLSNDISIKVNTEELMAAIFLKQDSICMFV